MQLNCVVPANEGTSKLDAYLQPLQQFIRVEHFTSVPDLRF
jgi:hypothetical protein